MTKGKCFQIFSITILSILFMSATAFAGDWHIKGHMFQDKNCNLIRNSGEKHMPVYVFITCTGPGIKGGSQTKKTKDKYDFDTHHKPGTYTLTVTVPSGWCCLSPNPATVVMVKKDIKIDFAFSRLPISPGDPNACCP